LLPKAPKASGRDKATDGAGAFEAFDSLFRRVVSVSNKVIRERIAEEKKARHPRRGGRAAKKK